MNYFARTTGHWFEAELHDYSAEGICFFCKESLEQNTRVTVQIASDANDEVPAIAASAVVLRCEQDDERRFKIACKFKNVMREKPVKVSRFRLND